MNSPQENVTYLTEKELVWRWKNKISGSTLRHWRKNKHGPAFVKFGGRVLYPLDFVEEYEQENTIIPKK
jgi:hypothetical protein